MFSNHVYAEVRCTHLRNQFERFRRQTVEDLCFESIQRLSRDLRVTESLAAGGSILEIIAE